MNKVLLVGRITKDVELKKTQSGINYANFSLAVQRPFKNEEGESEADFINCTAWSNHADVLASFTHKGDRLGVEGRIATRTYTPDDGITRYVTEVVVEGLTLLESKKEPEKQEPQPRYEKKGYTR